ncbi:YczE/YyaS/YitT family protein [Desulfosporosinus meridiei]|uniref:Putative membrane protein n=1 Tax=Desulfosporosinus meridiei (strain ATCC BAA-275 / DSM 13257 / KCTC 12902 / NCIMB 13706 / S10) TaxID=768704 RepID=J7IT79_DESMD|nr:DUF6198 family protein [Desulfosporosinus meridiei]AFQ45102.1 putative membrane protein [Desulfosporosinus meridiei DSM 13257]
MKIKNFAEMAYLLGLIILALGVALMEKADLGISMVVAPAYLISLKVNFLTFGMAEYTLQAVLLIFVCLLLGQFKLSYCFSFVTAVIYGLVLDGWIWMLNDVTAATLSIRIPLYLVGMLFCAMGISLLFHTYLAPEVYELFVKEVSKKYRIDINKFKIGYDCTSCAVAVAMSYLFFNSLRGVGIGTVICALVNGLIIAQCSKFFEKHIDFSPKLPSVQKYF